MAVGGQYDRCGNPLDSFFSLLQMLCQSYVFYFDNSKTICFT